MGKINKKSEEKQFQYLKKTKLLIEDFENLLFLAYKIRDFFKCSPDVKIL